MDINIIKIGDLKMDVSKTIKVTASVLSVMGVVFVSAFFMEDRYQKIADAKTTIARLEKASVETFQQLQQTLRQERIIGQLDNLREDRQDVERRLEKDPNSVYLQNKLERIKSKIRRLENRLY